MSAPILITRESLAAGAAERWREQYEDYWTSERPSLGVGLRGQAVINSRDTYERLVALGATPDPDDVDGVIGNTSWTTPWACHGCERHDTTPRVMVGAESDSESPTACLCVDCAMAAVAAFDRVPSNGDEWRDALLSLTLGDHGDDSQAHASAALGRIQQLESALAASKRHAARWKALSKDVHKMWVRRPAYNPADHRIEDMGPSERGGFEIHMSTTQAVRNMAESFFELLQLHDAPNCVEVGLSTSKGEHISVEVRRHGGKTMAQLRDEAIARAELAERELAELKAGGAP